MWNSSCPRGLTLALEFFVCLFSFVLFAVLVSLFPVSTVFQILMCFHIYRNFLPQFVPCQCHRIQLLLDGHHHKPFREERSSQALAAGACIVRSDSLLWKGHSPSVSLGPRVRWLSTAWLVTEHVYGRRCWRLCWRLWGGPCSLCCWLSLHMSCGDGHPSARVYTKSRGRFWLWLFRDQESRPAMRE